MSSQTLSWLPEYERPIEEICNKIKPEWMAFSSLFWDGNIDYRIELRNYDDCIAEKEYSTVHYNVISIPHLSSILRKYGYHYVYYEPFEIDMDIEPGDTKKLSYYTVKTEKGKRMAFNTCLYQPEGFVFAKL